eukprot:TRINITY_DN26206_c0_g1_i1.p1 TRINITY_DN26206_c0_g1~~TRINITY_DN26206_c0_g1_i1.p1  ORF type:complete len:585 (+),score=112.44 TRINITY_DN26206_c0_g1_i1:133-1755(+)
MDKYRQTVKAMRQGKSAIKDQHWLTQMDPIQMMGWEKVVWARDCRRFLTAVHEPLYADFGRAKALRWKPPPLRSRWGAVFATDEPSYAKFIRPTRKSIPLADFESALRRFQMVGPEHGFLLRAIAWVPLLRDLILVRRGLLYSRDSRRHMHRVKEWCASMRHLADLEESYSEMRAEQEESQKLLKGEGGPAPQGSERRYPKRPSVGGEVSTSTRGLETVPFSIAVKTLVGMSKHRGVLELVQLLFVLFIVAAALGIVVRSHGETFAVVRCVAFLLRQKAMGAPCTKESLSDYLCRVYRSNSSFAAASPEEGVDLKEGVSLPKGFPPCCEEVRDGKVVLHSVKLQNSSGHIVTVVPIPQEGHDAYFWWAGEALKACGSVGLPLYTTHVVSKDINEGIFLPHAFPAVACLQTYEYFLPLYHGSPPHPKIFGMWPGTVFFSGPLAEFCILTFATTRVKVEAATADIVAHRATMVRDLGVAHFAKCTRGATAGLINAGYTRVLHTDEQVAFDGNHAVDVLTSLFPVVQTLLDEAGPLPSAIPNG